MTLSTTSSIKPVVQTLKGIFNAPKMNHRRDFLRENKLSLRELQRVTSRKQATQQQEQQQKTQRQQDQHQQQQQNYARRRSASQQRTSPPQAPAQQRAPVRAISQQRKNFNTGMQQKITPIVGNVSRCSSCGCSGHGAIDRRGGGDMVNRVGKLPPNISRGTLTSKVSKAKSCHKEIQTDDIHDEKFLYNALKKCSSEYSIATAVKGNERATATHSDPNVPITSRHVEQQQQEQPFEQNYEYEAQSYYGDDVQQQYNGIEMSARSARYSQQQQGQPQNPYTQYSPHQPQYNDEDNLAPDTARSHASHRIDTQTQLSNTARTHASHVPNGHTKSRLEEDLNGNLTNMALEHPAEQPLSGRSRRTIYSMQSQESILSKKRSNGSLHQLGSRDDVRLPRYLEREKREKEEQRARQMERDPNCPAGHFVLPEQERITALTGAEKKYKSLVQELNRMPMTTETLRIRTRKAEIEKQLVLLEADIRIFSKPKVYIKQTE